MSEVTLETLERSFKETIADLLKQLTMYVVKNDGAEPSDMKAKVELYIDEMIEAAEKCGGSADDVKRWTEETVRSINLYDLTLEAIKANEEDES